ncbi:MAG: HupE/UreJ family protein [Myxococcota bacterium]
MHASGLRSGLARVVAVATALLALLAAPAVAHDSRFTTLQLEVVGARVEGRWEIHPTDARIALGLDPDLEGESAWRELQGREAALRGLLVRGLTLYSGSGSCPVSAPPGLERSADGELAWLRVRARCAAEIAKLTIDYGLMFDLDPDHRAYFSVRDALLTHAGVLRADEPRIALDIRRLDRWRTFSDYTREGVWHILTGFDHLLFLTALLLPAPLLREAGRWRRRPGWGATSREVVKMVTAFTLAHSLTLALSVLGGVGLPSRAVESAIALSVWLAAWNNLRPFLPERGAQLAFALGLVHGLGFAGALEQMGLPRDARGLALASFNLGVEAGQLALVALLLPVLLAASRRSGYVRGVLQGGSFVVAWIAALWVLERLLGQRLWRWNP